jgi:quinol monooxygenase YgiN
MLLYRRFLLGAALLAGLAIGPAYAQPATSGGGAVYVVTYFEVGATFANKTATQLKAFAAATRKENGNENIEVLREVGPAGRFAMVEKWRDHATAEAHEAAVKALSAKLQPMLASPFDTRACIALDVGALPSSLGPTAGYVLTHVDVVPTHKDEAIALLHQLAAASRKEHGALRFDALQQGNRPNHSFLVEAWADAKAHDAHVMAAATREFRSRLLPLQGALFDERIYQPIR